MLKVESAECKRIVALERFAEYNPYASWLDLVDNKTDLKISKV